MSDGYRVQYSYHCLKGIALLFFQKMPSCVDTCHIRLYRTGRLALSFFEEGPVVRLFFFSILADNTGTEYIPTDLILDFLWKYAINDVSKPEKRRTMPKLCEICGKGPQFGNSVSHSHKASKKKWSPNLQRVKAQTKAGVRHIWVCTRCLHSDKVIKST